MSFVAGQAFLLFSVSRQQSSSTLKPLFAPILHPVAEQQQQQQQQRQPAASELSTPSGRFAGADPGAMIEAFTSVLANTRCLVACRD